MSQESMYIEIYNDVKNSILTGKYKLNDMLPTEAELAAQYFTSRITIRKAMDKLKNEGFIKRIAGRGTFILNDSVQSGFKQKTLGVILCNIGASFGLDLLNSIERKCSETGYNIILKNSRDDSKAESQAINDLVAANVSGIIIQPVHKEYYNKHLIFHHFNKFPFVLVDRHFVGFTIPSVSTNNLNAATSMTEYLIGKGHREICFMSCDPIHTSTVEERLSGFKSTCILNGIRISDNNIFTDILSPHVPPSPEIWRGDIDRIKTYLGAHPEITCIFSSEFTVTKLADQALREMNKKIGVDISLATFDHSEGICDIDLTRVEQNQTEIGRFAAEILLRRIGGEPIADKFSIPHNLIPGHSVLNISR